MTLFGLWRSGREALDDVELDQRLVVFDLETTGLNPTRDKPLSIGAVAIEKGRISVDDCFHLELQAPDGLSADNVLVHRLTPDRLAEACPAAEGLKRFLDYRAGAPMLAYHANFDREVLRRAVRRELNQRIKPVCLDVAQWVLNVEPGIGSRPPALDVALGYFRIQAGQRHDALRDAWLTAQLCLILLQRSQAAGVATIGELRRRLRAGESLRRSR